MMRQFTTVAALFLGTTVQAQPYSESMADCAAIYQNAAQWVPSDEVAEKLMVGARQWHDAAVRQSAAEGNSVTESGMWEWIDVKTAEWEAKGASFLLSQEFREWSGYCRSFAKHTGVKLNI